MDGVREEIWKGIMNIGLDIHGVLDRYPEEFITLVTHWKNQGHKIYIITGQTWEMAEKSFEELPHGFAEMSFNGHFSILDYHKEKGTHMWLDTNGWWLNDEVWNSSKGKYARRMNIDVHFDDMLQYEPAFPISCKFFLVDDDFDSDWKKYKDLNTCNIH